MTLQLSVAQLNFTVGDMAGNARKIIEAARQAYSRGVRLLVTPELAICGYAAEDLFLRPSFSEACQQAVSQVQQALADLRGMHVVVGHPSGDDIRTRSVSVPSVTTWPLCFAKAFWWRVMPNASCPITKCLMSEGILCPVNTVRFSVWRV